MEIGISEGKVSVKFKLEGFDSGSFYFCTNGYQSTGVHINKQQFKMLQELMKDPRVLDCYKD